MLDRLVLREMSAHPHHSRDNKQNAFTTVTAARTILGASSWSKFKVATRSRQCRQSVSCPWDREPPVRFCHAIACLSATFVSEEHKVLSPFLFLFFLHEAELQST